MLAFVILISLILLSWLRVARFGRVRPRGAVIHDARLPLLARIRMHLVICTVVLGAAVLLVIFAGLPWWGPLLALVSNLALVLFPIRYTLTTLGIRCGWTPFRRWTEFAGVSRAPGGARLQGVTGSRDMRIWLSGSRGDDEFVLLLRRMITGAYKGRNVLRELPPRKSSSPPGSTAASSKVSRTTI